MCQEEIGSNCKGKRATAKGHHSITAAIARWLIAGGTPGGNNTSRRRNRWWRRRWWWWLCGLDCAIAAHPLAPFDLRFALICEARRWGGFCKRLHGLLCRLPCWRSCSRLGLGCARLRSARRALPGGIPAKHGVWWSRRVGGHVSRFACRSALLPWRWLLFGRLRFFFALIFEGVPRRPGRHRHPARAISRHLSKRTNWRVPSSRQGYDEDEEPNNHSSRIVLCASGASRKITYP